MCVTAPNYKTSCVSQSCPFSPYPSTHTRAHTHTRTHSNRWLILTEIIRQQSHQHGSVVIRVWTQCLFSSRNGRSAWRKRREMHYSPWCPDLIQRHMVAPSSLFLVLFCLPPPHTHISLPATDDKESTIAASATFALSFGSLTSCLSLWSPTVSSSGPASSVSCTERLTGRTASQHSKCVTLRVAGNKKRWSE